MPDDWRNKAKQRVKEKREGDSFKLLEGENCFRIMPNKKGTQYAPYVEFRIHRNVGPDHMFVRCGKHMDGTGKCWLCDVMIPSLIAKKKSHVADDIGSHEQFMVQAARYNPESEKFGKAKPWWVSTGGSRSLSVTLLSLLSSTKRSYDDPKKGYNLTIERTGTGMKDTRYGAPIPDDAPSVLPTAVLATVKSFEEVVPRYSVEEQKAAYYGRKPGDDEPEEESSEEDDSEGNGGAEESSEDLESSEEDLESAEEEGEGEEEPEAEEESPEESESEEDELEAAEEDLESGSEDLEEEPEEKPKRTKKVPPKSGKKSKK